MCFLVWIVSWLGKAPGFAALTFAALSSASLLTAAGRLGGAEYVAALAVILGAHFGGGVAVARRDRPAAQIEGGKQPPVDGPG